MHSDREVSPINPLPPVVVAIFLAIFGIEIVFSAAGRGLIGGPEAIGWRLEALRNYAFSADVFDWMIRTGNWPAQHLARFVTYPFVHGSFTHMLIASVIFLAMGKMVAETFGGARMAVIFVLSGIGGALAYWAFQGSSQPLFGAFPPVYGLIGAFTFLLWKSLASVGENQARAFTLIAFLMGIQLVFGLFFGAQTDWVADLGGFATGFALSFVVAPGAMARMRRQIRRD